MSYEGLTTRGTNIQTDSTCTSPDGYNVVAFGDLLSNHVGYFCGWAGADIYWDDTDFKLNKFDHSWYAQAPPLNCNLLSPRPYNIQAVATHERGHTFGLAHKSTYLESEHPWLTMSPAINGPCQNSEITLGYGDLLGLEYLY